MSDLMIDVSQAHELKLAMRKNGVPERLLEWTNADIKALCENDALKQLLLVLRGFATIIPVEHIIDCNKQPIIPNTNKTPSAPEGWSLIKHKQCGVLTLKDIERLKLYRCEASADCEDVNDDDARISGTKLDEELEAKSRIDPRMLIMNVCLRDYLLTHQGIIPEVWRGWSIFFFGTIYRGDYHREYVPYMCMEGDKWVAKYQWLAMSFGYYQPVPILN